VIALERLSARNFKSLRDVEVPLGPISVLVGPNGAGKSNFLDLIQFLGDSVRSDLEPAVAVRGGYSELAFRGQSQGPIHIEVVARVTSHSSPKAPDVYTLDFYTRSVPRGRSKDRFHFLSREEAFKFKRTRGQGRRIEIKGHQAQFIDEEPSNGPKPEVIASHQLGLRGDALGLAALPRLSDSEGGREIRKIADMFAHFRVFDVNVEAARLPSPREDEVPVLRDDAANLASFLSYLSEDEDLFAELCEDAKAMIPGLVDIQLVEVGGAQSGLAIYLEEHGLRGMTALGHASYGTVRTLALLALLYDPDPPLLTCIEEIDHGLHPYVFDRMIDRLRIASGDTQFLIATHSPALVNRLRPEELIVCERDPETGETLMPAIESKRVREMEEAAGGELGLGELWFTGSLGGVPHDA
jgi:predicted ATPase